MKLSGILIWLQEQKGVNTPLNTANLLKPAPEDAGPSAQEARACLPRLAHSYSSLGSLNAASSGKRPLISEVTLGTLVLLFHNILYFSSLFFTTIMIVCVIICSVSLLLHPHTCPALNRSFLSNSGSHSHSTVQRQAPA